MDDTLSPRPDDDKPERTSSATPSADSPPPFSKIPTTVEETGLDEGFLLDLLVKALYTGGSMSGYEAAERLMLADMPIIPIYHYTTQHLVGPRVKGWVDNIMDVHPSQYLSLAE